MTRDDVDDRLGDVADQLAATAELPVEREASRWLGEAQAVVDDLRDGDPDAATVRKRLDTVAELLEEATPTGTDAGDDHVAAARELLADLESTLEDND